MLNVLCMLKALLPTQLLAIDSDTQYYIISHFNLIVWFITQVCEQKTFLTRVAVSYAFFRADNGKNSEKVPSRTTSAQISILDFGTQWITTGC